MKTTISLANLSSILESEKSIAQDKLKEHILYRYATILPKFYKEFSLPLNKIANMLFYPYYTLEISFKFEVYKIGDKTFSSKKPNFFIRIFKKVSLHTIKISHQNIFIDDVILDKKQQKEIKINI
ncbi:hypothetical protein Abu_1518 [Aliarcobacter butzleri RM4018]|uniref:Uncharacterized protein n=1 Tax=Aliarcobacter butzleri (strain RM4018) TaxID=367737 RepID=A8EUZ9_ALIB4|nr:hypothetical protein [Aliarcobacter butzleri]ABV67772.1 hypothetical protein Abu_1518 [Aliarcobacter butzleri RM4018]GGT77562.1 hypothetical protein GCM10007985_12040 [Aliarcobacter butzleri]SNV30409.1 Uncharacterised protein [Aliarcobacter butzleri]